MTQVPFRRVKELLGEVRHLGPDERSVHLDRACEGDPALRAEVESLLAEADAEAASGDVFLAPRTGEAAAVLAEAAAAVTKISGAGTALPERIGDYRVLGLLGAGGMGAVYEAEQEHPRRRVALKMVRPGFVSVDVLKRFHREAAVLGRLTHPGIARIYDAGTVDLGAGEQPFFAMELVDGEPITAYADRHDLDVPARLELFARVCDAVHHAHQNGVVHRDLKPDNILVTREEDTAGTGRAGTRNGTRSGTRAGATRGLGQPRILDFGVARAVDDESLVLSLQTSTGQLVGTLPYMSPEQVVGDVREVDARSDVYALGVLLFELLVGRLPYDLVGRSVPEAARIIREDDPTRLGSVDTTLRGDVDTIVAKALEKDPARRYASAQELAGDVLRHLHHEPIQARPASTLYQIGKFAVRHRGLVTGLALAFVALAVGLGFAIHFGLSEAEQKAEARYATYRASLAAAQAMDDPSAALARLRAAPEEFRGWEFGHLERQLHPELQALADPGLGAAGRRAAVAFHGGRAVLARCADDELRVTDVWSGASRVLTTDGLADARDVALSGDGSLLAVRFDQPPAVRVWALGGDAVILDRPLAAPGRGVALSSDGARLAFHEEGRGTTVLDTETGEVAWHTAEPPQVDALVLSADGASVATAGPRGSGVQVVTAARAGKLIYEGRAVALAPDGARAAYTGEFGVTISSSTSAEDRVTLGGYHHQPLAVAYDPRGTVVAAARRPGLVDLWDVAAQRLVRTLPLGDGLAISGATLAFDDDGVRLLAATSAGATILDVASTRGTVLVAPDDTPGRRLPYLYEAVFSPDGRLIAAGGAGRQVQLFDALTGAHVARLRCEDFKVVSGVAFSEDGTRVLALSQRSIASWDAAVGASSRRLRGPEDFPADTGARRPFLMAWWADTASRSRRTISGVFQQGEQSTADRTQVVEGRDDGFEITDLETGEVLVRSGEPSGPTPGDKRPAVALSPDETLVATGSTDGTVRLWDARDGRERAVLRGHSHIVYSVTFSPDGRRLASGSRDGTVRVWDVGQHQELLVLQGHDDYVHSVAFSPDGTRLVTSSGDGTARVWDSVPARLRHAERVEHEEWVAVWRGRVAERLEAGETAEEIAAGVREDAGLEEGERAAALVALLEVGSGS